MSPKSIFGYILVLLLPTIPIIILYLIFAEFNYFELKDEVKGIVATGPIGVYIVLLGISWNIFRKMFPDARLVNANIKKLIGTWDVESTSVSKHTYKGEMEITEKDYNLDLSGKWEYNGNFVATSNTIFSKLDHNILHVVYRITDQRDKGSQELTGYSSLIINYKQGKMEGTWAVVNNNTSGHVIYKKREL